MQHQKSSITNAKLGRMEEWGITRGFELDEHNYIGECLIKFCEENVLFIANVCFKQQKYKFHI